MATGGVKVKQRTRETVRIAGVLIPSALAYYGVFINLMPIGGFRSEYIFPAIIVPWILTGLGFFFYPAKDTSGITVRLVVFHLFAIAYILLIAGFLTPFVTLAWVLLMLVTFIYTGRKGLALNLGVLLLVAATDIALHSSYKHIILIDIASVAAIVVIGAVFVVLQRIQQADSDELARSQVQEVLQSNRINTLINNLADAVININQDGTIEVYNAASLDLLNTNVGLQGRSIDDVINLTDQSGEPVALLSIAKKTKTSTVRDDLVLVDEDEVTRLEVTISPIRSSYSKSKGKNASNGYVLILRDITKAKSLEEERDEFISVVSHELRTPITIAEGTLSNVQLMIDKGQTPPGALERSLVTAHEQIVFLSKMVNDLSTLSRAERGVADTPEQIDVKSLVDSLYAEYAPQAEKKQLHFNIETTGKLGTVTASHLYLRELLQNIVTNAIKYTKEGSVGLSVSRKGNLIHFAVKDTGIGISKNDQVKIFHKFYRSEDYRTRETGGTGLGLYVAFKLAKKLSTKIEVKSRLNHGSTFSFTLAADEESL